jgi:rsbT co-antagonist protein RsbR
MPIDHDEEKSSLLAELATLRQRVAELSREADEARQADALLRQRNAEQTAMLHAIPAPVFFKDRDHRYVFVNQAYADSLNRAVEDVIGKHDEEIFSEAQARTFHDTDETVMATGMPLYNVEVHLHHDGIDTWNIENNIPYRDSSGRVVGLLGVAMNVTVRKQMEQALQRTEAELRAVVERQESLLSTIAALSTPVLPIHDRVLVMPLVGQIDTTRSAQIMEAMLAGVARHCAEFVVMDLTGVPFVDTAVASHLLRAARAVGLLGAQCVVVGLSPAIAAALASLGVEFGGLVTLGDLEAGVRYALSRQRGAGAPPRGK